VTVYELFPEGDNARVRDAHRLVWPVTDRTSDTVRTSLDPWLRQVGRPAATAIDLVRLAAGAYIADRLTPRRAGFSRTIDLHVHLTDPGPWDGPLGDVANLLFWLTGDDWYLEASGERLHRPAGDLVEATAADVVSLLSGGLDSFCGAVLAAADEPRITLGHWDNTIVKRAQDESWTWLTEHAAATPPYLQVQLTQVEAKRERSTRSRALLFMAIAAAVADGAGAAAIEVPENGFTSLNPPLGADRGGALSTRSTHPHTLRTVDRLFVDLGLDVRIRDPYTLMTKGELLTAAAKVSSDQISPGAALTISCGKLDGRFYPGGNTNYHCGLCVPCLVRRGAFITADVHDLTPYLSNELKGAALNKLLERRADDIAAVRSAFGRGIDEVDVIAGGPFPDDFDINAGLDLCARGLAELRAVPLP
jgi:7-cyano-7-deazaguanine synthase in queuosine biosynthesis